MGKFDNRCRKNCRDSRVYGIPAVLQQAHAGFDRQRMAPGNHAPTAANHWPKSISTRNFYCVMENCEKCRHGNAASKWASNPHWTASLCCRRIAPIFMLNGVSVNPILALQIIVDPHAVVSDK